MKIKNIYRLLCFFLFLSVSSVSLAQLQDIEGFVTKSDTVGPVNGKGFAVLFLNKVDGKNYYEYLLKQEKQNEINFGVESTKFDPSQLCEMDQVRGRWYFDQVSPGNVVVILIVGYSPILVEVVAGKLLYESKASGHVLNEVYGDGKRKRTKGPITDLPPVSWNDSIIDFSIETLLGPDYLKPESRFMFVNIAYEYPTNIECGFIPPAVYDTRKYKKTQVRRKIFDYELNDSLACYQLFPRKTIEDFSSTEKNICVLNKDSFYVKYTFRFIKPDKKKKYYRKGIRECEDYTHVYFADSVIGSHLTREPWRFLGPDFAALYGELTEDLKETPRQNVRSVPRDLDLFFIKGTATLVDSYVNDSIKTKVENEMRKYHANLQQVTIQGAASPDGSLATNTNLANNRASYAINWLHSKFPGVNVKREEPKVFKWEDVAVHLEKKGHKDIADVIRAKEASGQLINRSTMSNWEEDIEPVLNELRIMKLSYMVREEAPLSPEEAVKKFLEDPQYPKFSNGDFYNIYITLKDTLALERLTSRIYHDNIEGMESAKYSKFYSYVANRYLADQLKHGKVDWETPKILNGFVDLDTLNTGYLFGAEDGVPTSEEGVDYFVNRFVHLANLALVYFKLGDYKTASIYSSMLPEEEEKYQAVKNFAVLRAYFPDDWEKAERGVDYIWNLNPLSRAIFAVEMHDYLPKDDERVLSVDSLKNLIWNLPDSEPKKWYLLANVSRNDPVEPQKYVKDTTQILRDQLLKKQDEMLESVAPTQLYTVTSTDEYKNLLQQLAELEDGTHIVLEHKDSIPDYLAILQHCFDIDSTYYQTYLEDVDFDDKVRKAKENKKLKKNEYLIYKYDPRYIEDYRRKFEDFYKYYQENMSNKPKDSSLSNDTQDNDEI